MDLRYLGVLLVVTCLTINFASGAGPKRLKDDFDVSGRKSVLVKFLTDRFAQPSSYSSGTASVHHHDSSETQQRRVVFRADCTAIKDYSMFLKKQDRELLETTRATGSNHMDLSKAIASAVQYSSYTYYITTDGGTKLFTSPAIKVPCASACGSQTQEGVTSRNGEEKPYTQAEPIEEFFTFSVDAIAQTNKDEVEAVFRAVKELVSLCAPPSPPNPYK